MSILTVFDIEERMEDSHDMQGQFEAVVLLMDEDVLLSSIAARWHKIVEGELLNEPNEKAKSVILETYAAFIKDWDTTLEAIFGGAHTHNSRISTKVLNQHHIPTLPEARKIFKRMIILKYLRHNHEMNAETLSEILSEKYPQMGFSPRDVRKFMTQLRETADISRIPTLYNGKLKIIFLKKMRLLEPIKIDEILEELQLPSHLECNTEDVRLALRAIVESYLLDLIKEKTPVLKASISRIAELMDFDPEMLAREIEAVKSRIGSVKKAVTMVLSETG